MQHAMSLMLEILPQSTALFPTPKYNPKSPLRDRGPVEMRRERKRMEKGEDPDHSVPCLTVQF
jgi:hypothetical protein